jgi:hypothetical protein
MVGVLVVAAINCLLLFLGSLFAAGGDGSSDGIRTVWIFGYSWLAFLTVVALVLCVRNKRSTGLVVAVGTLPMAYVLSIAVLMLSAGIDFLKPSTPEFTAACKTSGVQFFAQPTMPVHSLSYDWGRAYPIDINYFRIFKNRITDLGSRNLSFPDDLTFASSKDAKTDVLVSFTYPIGKDELGEDHSRQGLIGYEVSVSDQRDKRMLATLRYFTDLANGRACGPTVDGDLSVSAFVLKAIGVR